MELLKLSKFKLNLQALIAEVRELRFQQRERSASHQFHLLKQKQQQIEEESCRKLTELQSELALSNEVQQNLERKVSCLENDNALLENKQKELKETINSLLQSRENFVKVYEDSTCEMKRSIESKDRKISLLSEKINTHFSLFDSIEKEAFSVKEVLDNVQHVLSEKEEIVADLKIKVDKVSTFEKLFVERINNLEKKLRSKDDELRRKNKTISELESQLDAEKNRENRQLAVEELQETLSAKERIIENLISEKKALHFELGSLNFFVKKIQDTVVLMNEESRSVFSSVLRSQEECTAATESENRIEVAESAAHKGTENSLRGDSGERNAENTASLLCEENKSVSNPTKEMYNSNSCVPESVYSPPRSAFWGPEFSANVPKPI